MLLPTSEKREQGSEVKGKGAERGVFSSPKRA